MYADTNFAPVASSRSMMDRMGSFLAALRDYRRERLDLIRLSKLDDHILSDIGVTRDEVLRAKPRPISHFVG